MAKLLTQRTGAGDRPICRSASDLSTPSGPVPTSYRALVGGASKYLEDTIIHISDGQFPAQVHEAERCETAGVSQRCQSHGGSPATQTATGSRAKSEVDQVGVYHPETSGRADCRPPPLPYGRAFRRGSHRCTGPCPFFANSMSIASSKSVCAATSRSAARRRSRR